MSVPLPAPDGPEMTKSRATRRLPAQQRDELGALTIRQTTDRLRTRHTALLQHLGGLDATNTRHAEHQVVDLRGQDPFSGAQQHVGQDLLAALEIALQPRSLDANRVGSCERRVALAGRTGRGLVPEKRLLRGRDGRRLWDGGRHWQDFSPIWPLASTFNVCGELPETGHYQFVVVIEGFYVYRW